MLAYLDAASGSMIAAALASGFAGIGVLFKMYGNRVLGVFSPKRRAAADATRAALKGDADVDEVDANVEA